MEKPVSSLCFHMHLVPLQLAVGVAEGTAATCAVPPGNPATVHDFALGNAVGLTAWRWAVDEVALSCGSTKAPHAGVAANITGGVAPGVGFILAAWVKPAAVPAAAPGTPNPPPGPVLGLSSQPGIGGGESTVLSYDAATSRFVFSDRCTAAARADMSPTGSVAAKAAPGEWHYVAVAVEEGGRGAVIVNGATVLTFDTNAKRPGVVGAQLTLCAAAAAAGASAAATSRFKGLVDEAHVWVGNAITVAGAPEALTAAMFAPGGAGGGTEAAAASAALKAIGSPKLRLHFNAGVAAPTISPAAALAYATDDMLVASTAPWRSPVPVSVSPSSVPSATAGASLVVVTAVNLAPSRWLAAGVGRSEVSIPLASVSADGYSITTSTLALGDAPLGGGFGDGRCGSAAASTNGYHSSSSASLSFVPGGVDSAGLYARFTFAEWGSLSNGTRSRSHFYDYSGYGRHAAISLGVQPAEDHDGAAMEAAAFTKGYPATAVKAAKSSAPVSIPVPATGGYTLCAWVRLLGADVGEELLNANVPFAGTWVFSCAVTAATGSVTHVRVNGVGVEVASTAGPCNRPLHICVNSIFSLLLSLKGPR